MTGDRHPSLGAASAAALPADFPSLGPLVADRLRYRRGGRTLLDDVSFHAPPGQIVAVMGPSGSGKSSFLALLAGLDRPDSGTVSRHPADASLGLVLQAYGLANLLTAAENVEIALQPAVAAGRLTRADVRREASGALDTVGLSDVADHLIEELSGGQQQRVAVARALVTTPDILLADEFAAELDQHAKERIFDLVLGVARRGGIVVIATHDRDIAERCDRAFQLCDGRLHAGP
ncbi:MAG: ABC transporter ATP-binding protein [Jatrophihabitans sp.]|uniref:ABC transporter ATP-binding protein n=1 Tax=Jatrophihabitans sp. TaxID=1932789 RepID=UPI003F7E7F94